MAKVKRMDVTSYGRSLLKRVTKILVKQSVDYQRVVNYKIIDNVLFLYTRNSTTTKELAYPIAGYIDLANLMYAFVNIRYNNLLSECPEEDTYGWRLQTPDENECIGSHYVGSDCLCAINAVTLKKN